MTEPLVLLPAQESDTVLVVDHSQEDEAAEVPTVQRRPLHCDSDVLVFYLTSKMTPEQRARIVSGIEGEDNKGQVHTADWSHGQPGSEEDIRRLLHQSSVEGKPFMCSVVGFIDDQSAQDDAILMAESDDHGEIFTAMRIATHVAANTSFACNLGCSWLADNIEPGSSVMYCMGQRRTG